MQRTVDGDEEVPTAEDEEAGRGAAAALQKAGWVADLLQLSVYLPSSGFCLDHDPLEQATGDNVCCDSCKTNFIP